MNVLFKGLDKDWNLLKKKGFSENSENILSYRRKAILYQDFEIIGKHYIVKITLINEISLKSEYILYHILVLFVWQLWI